MTKGKSRLSGLDRAVLDTLLPSGANTVLPLGLLESGFDEFLLEFQTSSAPQLRTAFRLGLMAGSWVAPLLIGRPPPLSRLSPTDRERALVAMDRSSITVLRQLSRVLKTVCALHYGALPEVRRAIGYHW